MVVGARGDVSAVGAEGDGGEGRVHEPAALRRQTHEQRGEERQPADEIGPERKGRQAREGQVARRQHLRQQHHADRLHHRHLWRQSRHVQGRVRGDQRG